MPSAEEAKVIAAINNSRYIWRPAEALAKETGLSVTRVRTILETTSATAIVKAPFRNGQGYFLYTTREHLVHLSHASARYLGTKATS